MASDPNTGSHELIEKPLMETPLKAHCKKIDGGEKLQENANGRPNNHDNDQTRCSLNEESNGLENNSSNLVNEQSSDADINLKSDLQQSLSENSDRSSNCETEINSSNAESDVRPSSGNGGDIVGEIALANDDESNGVAVNHSDSDPDWVTDDDDDDETDDYDGVYDPYGTDMDDSSDDDGRYGGDDDDDDDADSSLDDFGLNQSIRDAIRKEKIETNTTTYAYKTRASVSDDMKDDCPICLNTFVDEESVRCLPCFHQFHTDCVDESFKTALRCPKCRMNIKNTGDYQSDL